MCNLFSNAVYNICIGTKCINWYFEMTNKETPRWSHIENNFKQNQLFL